MIAIKKSAADAIMSKLQFQCRVVIGELTRLYRGPLLEYNGWQIASFCTPEDLFIDDIHFSENSHSPQESLELLTAHISSVLPVPAPEEDILNLLSIS